LPGGGHEAGDEGGLGLAGAGDRGEPRRLGGAHADDVGQDGVVPLAVTAIVGNIAGARMSAKTGPRVPVLAGTLVMASSLALLTTVSSGTGFAVPADQAFSLRKRARACPSLTN
jgi:hypothetical protein